jgi:PAS domain S-box-containing protein
MRRFTQAIRVAGTYLFVAALWILVSDQVVSWLVADPHLRTILSTVKGWAFVAVTTALLYAALENDRRAVAKQAATASAAEQRFKRIVETVPDAILLVSGDGVVTYMNAAAERLLVGARGSQDRVQAVLADAAGPAGDPLPGDLNPIRRAVTHSVPIQGETISLRAQGDSRIVVIVNATPMAGEGASGVLLSLTDVTAEHRAIERVYAVSRLYQVLAETSQAVLGLAEGHDILREACRIAVEVAGLRMAWVGTVEQQSGGIVPVAWAGVVGDYLEGLGISARDVPEGRGPTGRAVREGVTTISNDIVHDPAMAPWRERALHEGYASSAALPLRMEGEVVGAFVVYASEAGYFDAEAVALLERVADAMSFGLEFQRRDEERRVAFGRLESYGVELERRVDERTAELSLANGRLAQADTAKSQFLANMSHELRTPLNSIIGFTGILLQGIAGDVNPEQRKQLEMVYRSGKYLLSLVNDVLDLSRIEAGRVRIAPEEFDVVETVSAVVGSMRPLVEQKGLALHTVLPSASLTVCADRAKVQQVVTNLVSNAVKFTASGSVSVEVSMIPGGRRFSVSVSDTGPGIPSSELDHIFEEFYQTAKPEGDKTEGSGLGLAITRRLARMMGGALLVRSEVGQGSTFEVVLPVRALDEARPEPLPDEGPLVLVADDDPESRGLASRWLERAGMRVLQAPAADAPAISAELSPSLVVLDLSADGGEGARALELLRSDPRTRELPVVCMLARRSGGSVERSVADACLTKPLAEGPFVAAVRDALLG